MRPVRAVRAPMRSQAVASVTAKTTTPTMLAAEQAAEALGLDVFDLAVCLRRFAVDELESVAAIVRRGGDQPNLGRFRRLLRAAEACEAAWDENLKAQSA